MGRRKKTHTPLAYAIVPRFMSAALAQGRIDTTAFAVWVTIRLYARDEERGEFSPAPLDLTNREIADATGITIRQVRNQLHSLEEAGLLKRLSGGALVQRGLSGTRWLQLIRPPALTRKPVSRKRISRKSEAEANSSPTESPEPGARDADAACLASSELVGGAGGSAKAEGHFPATDFPETHYPETGYPRDTTEERFKAVARKMQECGAYRGPAFEIATTMLTAEPACTVSWAEETFYRVFNEERRRGVTAEQAMRRTITRLKNGDWGNLTDVVAEADRRRQAATPAYQQAQPRPPAEPQPSTQAAAAAVWAAVLAILESEVPSAVYDTWLRDTTALGWDKAGMTLSVQVTDEEALEVLSTHCSEALEQALTEVLETQEPELAGAPGLLRVDFVPPGRVAEAKTTPPAEALWEQALKDIKLQVTRATFDTWLRLTQGTNLQLNGQGQFLVVQAHNHYAVEWLTGKLYPLILRNVIRVAEDDFGEQIDRDSFEIQFVAASQRP